MLHAAASAFVTGADRAVLAGAIATLAGAVIAFRTLRAGRPAAVDGAAPSAVAVPGAVPAAAPGAVPELVGAARG